MFEEMTSLTDFSPRRRRRLAACLPLVLSAGAVSLLLGSRPACADGGTEVRVTVVDEEGKPVTDTEVVLAPLDKLSHPITTRKPDSRKTGKKGTALFPFLPWNAQGEGRYGLTINREGYFIREFHIESRQRQTASDLGAGTEIQNDAGKFSHKTDLPPIMAKPTGIVLVDLTIGPDRGGAAPGAAATAGAATGAPAAPNDPIVAAKILAAQGKQDEAEASLKTLAASDTTGRADFELARLYHTQEKAAEENAALERVIAKDPKYPGAHYMMGKLDYQDGKLAEAIRHLEAETSTHPDDTVSQSTLANMYSASGRKEDAVRLYESVVAKDASNADALVALGGLYAGLGDLKKSEEAYSRVVALDPARADQVYYKVGIAINDQKDLSESERQRAADAFGRAIQANPKHAKAHRELGYILVGLGKMDEAKAHFKTYLDLTPKAPDAATIRAFLAE